MIPSLLVIGGASLDILHFRGRTERSPGGAGLYTSLAASRAGARVTMLGPRPSPMPQELVPAAARIQWIGPVVRPEDLPTFEIAHAGAGQTQIEHIYWRAEAALSPANLTMLERVPDTVYCIGLTDPRRQLEFVTHLRSLDRRVACGTYACAVSDHRSVVREILGLSDIFFCNEAEATGLFGSVEQARTRPGQILFITRGPRGARVVLGRHHEDVPAVGVRELDPTGAGDTFCGTVLALLARGEHPLVAADHGVAAAAEMVTGVGPETLLRDPPPPIPPADPRVRVDQRQVARIGRLIGSLPDVRPFDFTGDSFPPVGHPAALDFFFAATVQQFGFWTEEGGHYEAPMTGVINGTMRKGSDFLWAAYRRWLDEAPEGLASAQQATLDLRALADRTRDDTGRSPLPGLDLRLSTAQCYGQDMVAMEMTPTALVDLANAGQAPLASLLSSLDHVGGYKEDPLRKKAALLALILQQRPEGFLRRTATDPVPPIVDYHVQRSCLRMGMIRIDDEGLEHKLVARQVLSAADERAIREASYRAVALAHRVSGQPMGAVDQFFFQNRTRCPEMSTPECSRCPVDGVCRHAIGLFQPVFRTAWY